MNYRTFNLEDWIGHINEVIEDERELDGNEMRDLVAFLSKMPRWIPMVEREPTDEEKAEYFAQHGEELCYMLENEMPLNGQEVLVSTKSGIYMDVFNEEFYNFENIDIRDVTAWQKLPESYQGESEADNDT